uniref:Protein translocase subunit SecE n=1 Tax=candidate division WWE3 bacterium TaxID=2053526 RepID=A0A7C4XTR9_UNCKA
MQAIINYIKESFEEVKRVAWPSKKQAMRLTGLVIGVSVGVGLYVSGLDFLFTKAVALLLSGK